MRWIREVLGKRRVRKRSWSENEISVIFVRCQVERETDLMRVRG